MKHKQLLDCVLVINTILVRCRMVVCLEKTGQNRITEEQHVIFAADFLSQQYLLCDVQYVVVLSDTTLKDSGAQLLDTMLSLKLPTTHMDINDEWIDSQLETFFLEFYTHKMIYNFVLISSRYLDIVKKLNAVFLEHSSFLLAFHNIKFSIVMSSEQSDNTPILYITESLSHIDFDNLALVTLSGKILSYAITLMWRENKTRQFDDVTHAESSICILFPNIKNKLNGRVFRAHPKSFTFHSRRVSPQNVKDGPLYEGFVVDIVDIIAARLNFSYVYQPEPDIAENMSWTDTSEFIAKGNSDFGLVGWGSMTSGQSSLNLSVSYPLHHFEINAVYIDVLERQLDLIESPLISIFQKEVCLALLASFLATFTLSVIFNICSACSAIPNTNDPSIEKENTENTIDYVSDNRTTKVRYVPTLTNVADIFFGLIGSIFQQGSLPETRPMSARVLLWAWSLLVLVLVSTYKGRLTADRIKSDATKLYNDFGDILASGVDLCIPDEYLTYENAMRLANEGSLSNKLYKKSYEFKLKNPTECKLVKDMPALMKRKEIVLIVPLEDFIREATHQNITDVAVLKERFALHFFGIATSENSELNALFSDYIQKLADKGITEQLFRKWNRELFAPREETTKEINRKLVDFIWLFSYCGLGVLSSTFVFAVELGVYCVHYLVNTRTFIVNSVVP